MAFFHISDRKNDEIDHPVRPGDSNSFRTADTGARAPEWIGLPGHRFIYSIPNAGVAHPRRGLVIVQNGQVAHLQTFGTTSPGHAVTAQTPFEIGSCSKSFTALAVMQLVEAGKVDLDAPVQRHLPWFRVADAQASVSITIRNLLNQTSGLPTDAANRQTMVNYSGRTLEDQVRLLQYQPLTAAPGTLYQYSNLNYMTLALVIEAISNLHYGAYLQESIFLPLGMTNSYTDPAVARLHGFSDGYTWWFGLPFRSLEGPAQICLAQAIS